MINKGITVRFYTRKDGGIRVTQVGNVKFNAADSRNSVGNNYLRQLASQQGVKGANLDTKQYQQRTAAHASASTLQATSKSFQKFFKEAKKAAASGKAKIKITWKQTQYSYKKYGEAFARKHLENLVLWATNKTNSGHWAKLMEYFDTYAEFRHYRALFEPFRDIIEATTTRKLIDMLYDWSEGGESTDKVKATLDKTLAKLKLKKGGEYAEAYKNVKPFVKIIKSGK